MDSPLLVHMLGLLAAVPIEKEPALAELTFRLLPVALFGAVLFVVFARTSTSLSAKLKRESINNPEPHFHNHGPLAKFYFRAVGFITANTVGRISGYNECHKAFLSSGSVCSNCGETLLNRSWMPLVRCFDAAGNPVPLMEARNRSAYFGCPKCGHQWPLRSST